MKVRSSHDNQTARSGPFGPSADSGRDGLRAGVTLVEFIVAFGIFAILITIAGGSFVRSVRIQRTALQLMSVNDNMGITIEQMMREMRIGYHFCTAANPMNYAGIVPEVIAQCAGLASGPDSSEIQFVNASNETVRYRWISEKLQRGVSQAEFFDPATTLCGEGDLDSNNGICYQDIIADNIKITNAYFDPQYNDDDVGTKYPPRITMSFSVTSNDPMVEAMVSPITIQTTVSARCGENSCPSDS